jgi:xanthine dehydrogenase accessory factor
MHDHEIYSRAAQVLETGENIALITVVSTTGSTPGKVGYKMLLWGQKPQTVGTIGGGLAEADMVDAAKSMLPRTENQVFKIDFAGDENLERGICGGSTELLIETFDRGSLPLFKELSIALEQGHKVALVSAISPHEPPKRSLLRDTEHVNASNLDFSPETIESITKVVDTEQPAKLTLRNGKQIFIDIVSGEPMLVIFGAGHLSYHIARYAKSLNFSVTVCDDRAELANKSRFPQADSIIVEDFETVFDQIEIRGDSYIVIVTRGHRCDEMVLEKAVKTDAKYIGMIGSKRKTSTILKKLLQRGIPEEALRRVYSPIGLSVGAVTPQEIALSIVCELVKIRRLGPAPGVGHLTIDLATRRSNNQKEGGIRG